MTNGKAGHAELARRQSVTPPAPESRNRPAGCFLHCFPFRSLCRPVRQPSAGTALTKCRSRIAQHSGSRSPTNLQCMEGRPPCRPAHLGKRPQTSAFHSGHWPSLRPFAKLRPYRRAVTSSRQPTQPQKPASPASGSSADRPESHSPARTARSISASRQDASAAAPAPSHRSPARDPRAP